VFPGWSYPAGEFLLGELNMNIQPVASPVASKLEDRPAQPVEQQAAVSAVTASDKADTTAAPSRDKVETAVKTINDAMLASSQSLEFSIDEDSKGIVVKVIDQATREVVRQMPSKEALEIAKSIDKLQEKMQGVLISQTA
jgi:flagellar protein FlaG